MVAHDKSLLETFSSDHHLELLQQCPKIDILFSIMIMVIMIVTELSQVYIFSKFEAYLFVSSNPSLE